MAQSELLDAILNDFLAAGASVTGASVSDFCAFAADWLAKAGIVGVGHTTAGLALRLADGTEKVLVAVDAALTSADTPAVAIGRGGNSARHGIGGGDTSVSITNA
jgi:hypothetical protein